MNRKLIFEFLILFVAVPVSLVFDMLIWFKLAAIVIALVYLIIQMRKAHSVTFSIEKEMDWKLFWKRTIITFVLIAVITITFVWYTKPSALFLMPLAKPWMYVTILFVYSLFSVWPQEIVYRTFFFERYKPLFKNEKVLIFANAFVFSLAHLFFKNTLVLLLTFVGGILFGFTFLKFKSTTAVTIEHAVYGNWLFTVGMGQMLGFPGIEGV
ncbi:CPBP family intramembrane glutamic endopeptidase [Patiriisocius sp. Uisw_017]|jgi:membrane protease YdiL (CAAX protease family)|uniref:CPBP family intramembrane glutamic endopeptidase n=1 Tax=Patiriisocius sp. Uisw_017 TaxID=3230968 RepID=UPI0039E95C99